MSSTEPLLFEMTDQVAVLRLNRPEQLNALTPAMLDVVVVGGFARHLAQVPANAAENLFDRHRRSLFATGFAGACPVRLRDRFADLMVSPQARVAHLG